MYYALKHGTRTFDRFLDHVIETYHALKLGLVGPDELSLKEYDGVMMVDGTIKKISKENHDKQMQKMKSMNRFRKR
jgi:hypothetical protein